MNETISHMNALILGNEVFPSQIFLSNVCSLCNKLDKLQLLLGKNSDFSSSSVLCFTETWFSGSIPDSNSSERIETQSSPAKQRGEESVLKLTVAGTNMTVILQHCSPDLKSFFH